MHRLLLAQAVAKYVEEALQEYSASADRKLGNDMLSRAAGPHIEVMEKLLGLGAEPSLIDKVRDALSRNLPCPSLPFRAPLAALGRPWPPLAALG